MRASDLCELYAGTKEADWSKRGYAWIHKDAILGDACRIHGGVFRGGLYHDGEFHDGEFCGGVFYGGVFHGGVFEDGVFHGGVFQDGMFQNGTFHGGDFRGGVFEDGTFHGGVFHGGKFNDGVFYGGEYHDGVFYGGEFNGGKFHGTPLYISGLLEYPVSVTGPHHVTIGCDSHTVDEWKSKLHLYASEHRVNDDTAMHVLDIVETWFRDHPKVVTEEQRA